MMTDINEAWKKCRVLESVTENALSAITQGCGRKCFIKCPPDILLVSAWLDLHARLLPVGSAWIQIIDVPG